MMSIITQMPMTFFVCNTFNNNSITIYITLNCKSRLHLFVTQQNILKTYSIKHTNTIKQLLFDSSIWHTLKYEV